MAKGEDERDDEASQQLALDQVRRAALGRDSEALLRSLVEARVLDGLWRRLDIEWGSNLHPMDRDQVISDAVDALCAAIQKGRTVSNVVAWLSKVAIVLAKKAHRHKMSQVELGQDQFPARDEDRPREVTESERAARLGRCLEVARGLLPEIVATDNMRRVMTFIFEAIEQGCNDLQPAEIAESLGLKPSSVRTWIERGYQRLAAQAKKEGFTRREYELIALEFETEPDDDEDDA